MPDLAEPPPVETPNLTEQVGLISKQVSSDLDNIFSAPAPPPAPSPETKTESSESPTTPTPKVKPPAKPAAPAKPPAPAKVETPPAETPTAEDESTGIKNIRQAYEKQKRELTELKLRLPDLEQTAEQHKTLAEEHTKATARLQALEEELKYADYQKSAEYQTKYLDPLKRAAQDLSDEFLGFTTDDGKAVTEKELAQLLNLPTQSALPYAKQLFGDLSGEAMAHRRRILQLDKNGKEALSEFRRTLAEREKQQRIAQDTQQINMRKTYASELDRLQKESPTLYVAEDNDDEGRELLENGYALVDATLDTTSAIEPDTRLKQFAAIRMKAGAFDRVAAALTAERKKTEELTAELEKFRSKDPGARAESSTTDANGAPRRKTADEEIDEMWRGV